MSKYELIIEKHFNEVCKIGFDEILEYFKNASSSTDSELVAAITTAIELSCQKNAELLVSVLEEILD